MCAVSLTLSGTPLRRATQARRCHRCCIRWHAPGPGGALPRSANARPYWSSTCRDALQHCTRCKCRVDTHRLQPRHAHQNSALLRAQMLRVASSAVRNSAYRGVTPLPAPLSCSELTAKPQRRQLRQDTAASGSALLRAYVLRVPSGGAEQRLPRRHTISARL